MVSPACRPACSRTKPASPSADDDQASEAGAPRRSEIRRGVQADCGPGHRRSRRSGPCLDEWPGLFSFAATSARAAPAERWQTWPGQTSRTMPARWPAARNTPARSEGASIGPVEAARKRRRAPRARARARYQQAAARQDDKGRLDRPRPCGGPDALRRPSSLISSWLLARKGRDRLSTARRPMSARAASSLPSSKRAIMPFIAASGSWRRSAGRPRWRS